jgi:hypothetical protein
MEKGRLEAPQLREPVAIKEEMGQNSSRDQILTCVHDEKVASACVDRQIYASEAQKGTKSFRAPDQAF